MPEDGPSRIDEALAAALADVAARLEAVGIAGRAPLRDVVAERLRARLGWRDIVIEGDRAALDGWPEHVEAVDVGVRGRFSGRTAAVAQVTWWDGAIDLQEALWEALRVAAVVRAGAAAGYLVAAAATSAWAAAAGAAAPFAEGERAVAPLLAEGGGDEAIVPSRLGTAPLAEETLILGGLSWGLRAVRVWPAGGDLRTPAPGAEE